MTFEVMRIFVPATLAFLIGVLITPFLAHYLYKYKMWKPKGGKIAMDGTAATEFNRLHELKEVGTPRFGGIVVWASVLLTADLLSLLARIFPDAFGTLAFISRAQTWVPLAAMAMGALVGFADDLFEVSGRQGLRLRVRLMFVATVAVLCAWWFYDKLDVSSVTVPFMPGPLELGILFIPLFVLVTLFIYAGGVIDGLDGLAGGIFATIFSAYAGIAFFQNQFDIAALCAALAGGLLAFLWFNIPPARFYLSETGSMALTIALVVVAFLTDVKGGGKGVSVLPLIALPLVATVASNIIQIFGKKVLGRKIFRIAPLHHHFEAIGWPAYKVTMRYWIVSVMAAIAGLALALV
ncbi:MAG: mraY [Candidatus Adlerbacteria bacterium]|nr:mraY [Candidatus Adlerbacteria bacterium]